jgi:hypothetical protein
MYSSFSRQARAVVELSRGEALARQSAWVRSLDLLAAVLQVDCNARSAILELGGDPDRLLEVTRLSAARFADPRPVDDCDLEESGHTVIDAAYEWSRRIVRGSFFARTFLVPRYRISTDHLLLGAFADPAAKAVLLKEYLSSQRVAELVRGWPNEPVRG